MTPKALIKYHINRTICWLWFCLLNVCIKHHRHDFNQTIKMKWNSSQCLWICIYAVYLNQWCYTSTRQKGREDALHNFIPARNYVHEWWSDVVLESQFWEYKVLGGESCGRKGKQQLGKGNPTQYAILFLPKPSILCNLICSSRSIFPRLAHNSNSCRTSNSGVGRAVNSNSCRTSDNIMEQV